MRFVLAGILAVHGIAHLVGFAVPWRLLQSDEMPYGTTVLSGAVDLGPTGIRVWGLLWLAAAIGFLVAGGGMLFGAGWSTAAAWTLALASLVMCVAGWPEAKAGIVVNAGILGMLAVALRLGWVAW